MGESGDPCENRISTQNIRDSHPFKMTLFHVMTCKLLSSNTLSKRNVVTKSGVSTFVEVFDIITTSPRGTMSLIHYKLSIIMVCECFRPSVTTSPAAANRPMDLIFGILLTFQSVCPPHGQWPAPMGSWRVYHGRSYSLAKNAVSYRSRKLIYESVKVTLIEHEMV